MQALMSYPLLVISTLNPTHEAFCLFILTRIFVHSQICIGHHLCAEAGDIAVEQMEVPHVLKLIFFWNNVK